jgi:hypothetical protein
MEKEAVIVDVSETISCVRIKISISVAVMSDVC